MRWIAALTLSLAATACSGSRPSASGSGASVQRTELRGTGEAAQAPSVAHQSSGGVLAEVRFRDHVLIIRAGAGQRRFDVRTHGGKLLATSLTREQLDARFPVIGAHFRDSQAIQLDATLQQSALGADSPAGADPAATRFQP
jgi:hypothetical protein